jgi:hypothetical protein
VHDTLLLSSHTSILHLYTHTWQHCSAPHLHPQSVLAGMRRTYGLVWSCLRQVDRLTDTQGFFSFKCPFLHLCVLSIVFHTFLKLKFAMNLHWRIDPSTHAPRFETVLLSYKVKFMTIFKSLFSYYIISWKNSIQKFACDRMQYGCATFFLDCSCCAGFTCPVRDPHQSAAGTSISYLSSVEIPGCIAV